MTWVDRFAGLIDADKLALARRQLRSAVNDGLDRHVRVAVTGLSHSGKTVLITALVKQLLAAHESRALPFFSANSEGRILAVKLLENDEQLAEFPYRQGLSALSATPPEWPVSTCELSALRLAIRYRPSNRLRKLVTETATLYLDLIDYPGEWLLDLPLLQLSYRQWCVQQHGLLRVEPRLGLAANWLQAVAGLNGNSPADETKIAELSGQFRGLLRSFREQTGQLSLIQPGRFILPGALEGSDLLRFFPLPLTMADDQNPQAIGDSSGRTSTAELLEQRYNAYRDQVVKRFYTQHFCRFDRQLVLVDCLKTLNQGPACFADMQQAISQILQSFNYGRTGLLRRLLSPRIDRVLFASSKADHITANQHHNLERFMELIINEAKRDILFEGVQTRSLAVSAFRSTEAAEALVDGQRLSCLKGYRKGSHEPVALFPGEVPTSLPGPDDWRAERFNFIDFSPSREAVLEGGVASHIRLDQLLEFLVGDKLL